MISRRTRRPEALQPLMLGKVGSAAFNLLIILAVRPSATVLLPLLPLSLGTLSVLQLHGSGGRVLSKLLGNVALHVSDGVRGREHTLKWSLYSLIGLVAAASSGFTHPPWVFAPLPKVCIVAIPAGETRAIEHMSGTRICSGCRLMRGFEVQCCVGVWFKKPAQRL